MQSLCSQGVPQFGQRLVLDLAHPFPGYAIYCGDRLKSFWLSIEAETHTKNPSIPLLKGIQNRLYLLSGDTSLRRFLW